MVGVGGGGGCYLTEGGAAWPRKDCVLIRSRVLWGIFVLVDNLGKWICEAVTAMFVERLLLVLLEFVVVVVG